MEQIAVIPNHIIEDLQNTQNLILKRISQNNTSENDEKYISRPSAAKMFDCESQTIANFENEGIIKRYGRGKFIRYSIVELKKAMGIE